jgi:hypothetical protein
MEERRNGLLDFGGKARRKEKEDLDAGGRITLRWILEK